MTLSFTITLLHKASRVHLQRLAASDIFMHFVNTSELHALEGHGMGSQNMSLGVDSRGP